jgi:hypothetical protein
MSNLSEELICLFSKRVKLPLGDIVLCKKRMGRPLPESSPIYKALSYEDGDFCVATGFNRNLHGHVIGGSRVNSSKMYKCPNRRSFEEEQLSQLGLEEEYKENNSK